MPSYSCDDCNFCFKETDEDWTIAFNTGRCPRCAALLKGFPCSVGENTIIEDDKEVIAGLTSPGSQRSDTLNPSISSSEVGIDSVEIFFEKIKRWANMIRWLLFGFNGRIGRSTAVIGLLLACLMPTLVHILIDSLNKSGYTAIGLPIAGTEGDPRYPMSAAVWLVAEGVLYFWVLWAICLKRFHDFNWSSGYLLSYWLFTVVFGLVSKVIGLDHTVLGIINIIFVIYFFVVKPGTDGSNEYGAGSGWINRPK